MRRFVAGSPGSDLGKRATMKKRASKMEKAGARKGSGRRRLAVSAGVLVAVAGGMWGAIHVFPGFGPMMADGARSVLGPGAVAWAEDTVYGIEDRVKRIVYRDAKPKTFWEPTAGAPDLSPPPAPVVPAKGAADAAVPVGERVDGLELSVDQCCLNNRSVERPVEVVDEVTHQGIHVCRLRGNEGCL